MRERPPSRVCVLGAPRAGKTCFLAGFGILAEPERSTPFQVNTHGQTKTCLDEYAGMLRRGEWPPRTTLTETYELTVLFGTRRFRPGRHGLPRGGLGQRAA